jgi:hypothetical protein
MLPKYKPTMKNNDTQTFKFKTPAPWAGEVSLPSLLDQIVAAIQAHVVLPAEAATTLAVWVVHTYLFEQRDAVAYVAIESPEKRCGKTTLLSVLAGLACKSLVASNITTGALFRAIAESSPTLFIDEADTFLAGNGVMRGILNCGNTWRTAFVVRLAPKRLRGHAAPETGESALAQYCCYCPKVVAMIGNVPDTIADRSILVRMERKLVTEKCAPLTDFHPEKINSQCAAFAAQRGQEVKDACKERIEGLNDRAADTFEPLAVIARMAGNEWFQRFVDAALIISNGQTSNLQGTGLLLDILAIFLNSGLDKVFSCSLANALSGGVEGMSGDYFGTVPVTEILLAKTLSRYGIRPSTIRIGSEVRKGYRTVDFREALNHYVPRAEIDKKLAEMEAEAVLLKEAAAIKAEEDVQSLQRLRKMSDDSKKQLLREAEMALRDLQAAD